MAKRSFSTVEGGRLAGLGPWAAPDARILVLGSFPSVESLRLQAYYGHPRNHFWELVAHSAGSAAPADAAERRAWLAGLGIAVWDVIASCERAGSLDQAIRRPKPNDLEDFLSGHPQLVRIVLNGSMAAAEFRRNFGALPPGSRLAGLETVAVPSSSPVPSRQWRRLEDKLPAWRAALDLGRCGGRTSGGFSAAPGEDPAGRRE
jgi:hypoxanthine-DNA glycosylase